MSQAPFALPPAIEPAQSDPKKVSCSANADVLDVVKSEDSLNDKVLRSVELDSVGDAEESLSLSTKIVESQEQQTHSLRVLAVWLLCYVDLKMSGSAAISGDFISFPDGVVDSDKGLSLRLLHSVLSALETQLKPHPVQRTEFVGKGLKKADTTSAKPESDSEDCEDMVTEQQLYAGYAALSCVRVLTSFFFSRLQGGARALDEATSMESISTQLLRLAAGQEGTFNMCDTLIGSTAEGRKAKHTTNIQHAIRAAAINAWKIGVYLFFPTVELRLAEVQRLLKDCGGSTWQLDALCSSLVDDELTLLPLHDGDVTTLLEQLLDNLCATAPPEPTAGVMRLVCLLQFQLSSFKALDISPSSDR